jgi:hypothetical protein
MFLQYIPLCGAYNLHITLMIPSSDQTVYAQEHMEMARISVACKYLDE